MDLHQKNNEVYILDNFLRGVNRRLNWLPNKERIFNVDVTDLHAVDEVLGAGNFDAVFHLAAINGTQNFYEVPLQVMDVGILGCKNILQSALKYRVKKVIVASSAEVYQNAPVVPTPEDVPLTIPEVKNPRYSYALSKIYTEYYSYHFGIQHGMNVAIFRPHNIYGPDMGFKHVIPEIASALIKNSTGEKSFVIPKGPIDVTRSFCHITDLLDGLNILLEKHQGVEVYNIGNNIEIDIKTLIYAVGSNLKLQVEIREGKISHQGTALNRCPDIKKMKMLGFNPKLDIVEGLKDTIHWYENNHILVEDNNELL